MIALEKDLLFLKIKHTFQINSKSCQISQKLYPRLVKNQHSKLQNTDMWLNSEGTVLNPHVSLSVLYQQEQLTTHKPLCST